MYEAPHRITYYDLDMHGQVKLSAFLRMVHIAADANATELGVGFRELSARDMTFILQRFAVRANRMPAYGECVTIRTWPAGVARGIFTRKGIMLCEKGEKIMEWASLWILFDLAARKILKPAALPIELPEFEDHGVEITPEKILLPVAGEEVSRHTHTVRYADVDTNKHMNNSVYGDLIGNALENSIPWREIQISYLAETRLGEEIEITAKRDGGAFIVTGAVNERNSFAARVL